MAKARDPSKTFLGSLCKRGHDHAGTGKSMRYASTGACVACVNAPKPVNGTPRPKGGSGSTPALELCDRRLLAELLEWEEDYDEPFVVGERLAWAALERAGLVDVRGRGRSTTVRVTRAGWRTTRGGGS